MTLRVLRGSLQRFTLACRLSSTLPGESESAFREVRGGYRGAGLFHLRRNDGFAFPDCVDCELLGFTH